jgi:amylosucrase
MAASDRVRSSEGRSSAALVNPGVVRERLGLLEGEAFLARLDLVANDLVESLTAVYGNDASLVPDLVSDALQAAAVRPPDLRVLDRRREVDQAWLLSAEMIGYSCYTDRFAGSLTALESRLDYLEELGIRYLHLMPLLAARRGENDGGYAVVDYDAVDPQLGTMADLQALGRALHLRRMCLCVDMVLNHTAREHDWARRAMAGDPTYREFYLYFPDRTQPDAYEQTLPEVFPDLAPGSFTHLPDTDEWVWTTFHEYQWDLNWANPAVFRAMLGVLLGLGNRGVDVMRLDAAPFLWKRLGTDCQNQPEAHQILQALRALTRLAMPGVALKAEAIVGPDLLVQYLGGHDHYRPECDLAYDNQLMVMLWSALAARDARLAVQSLGRRQKAPTGTTWVTYVRGHDDIGWAVGDEDAWATGTNPFEHRRFLAEFYAGDHPGSFSRGSRFQSNLATGDARTSGSAASLAGVEAALESRSAAEVEAALRRVQLLHSVMYSFGGIPLIFMGDEIALRNDPTWYQDPAHENDNRWMHRPLMDWAAAARRHEEGTVEARVFTALRRLGAARRSHPALRSDADTAVLAVENVHVLAYRRYHPRAAPLLALASFSDDWEAVDATVVSRAGVHRPEHLHSTLGRLDVGDGAVWLPPWGFAWITQT